MRMAICLSVMPAAYNEAEKQKKSVIPPCFWYLSIFGSIILLIYAIVRKDPVFIVAFLFNNVVYIRNLMLMFRHRSQKEA